MPQDAPKTVTETPKTLLDGIPEGKNVENPMVFSMIFRISRFCSPEAPRGPKMWPRRPKMSPRGLQEGPRWPQEGSKRGPTGAPRGISAPTWLREPSRKLPGPSQTPPGSDFGTHLVPKAGPRRPHCRQSRSNYRHASCFLLRCYVGTAAGFAAGRWIKKSNPFVSYCEPKESETK